MDKSDVSNLKIEASFTADTLVIRKNKTHFYIIYLNPDWTYKADRYFRINEANNEKLTFSGSNFYVKSDGLYYQ
jgi:hypothetical protein